MENINMEYGVVLEGSASSITKGPGILVYEGRSTFWG